MLGLNEKLIQAVCKGQTGNVVTLLDQGANVNCRDKKNGMTPLLKACQRRNYTMQKLLLSRGANPRLRDKLGLSCLHYIAEAGDTESIKLLMAYRANINAKDAYESSPLHYAADRNKLNAVDTLVFCGANAFEKNKKGVTPLKSAINPDVKQILKESELVLTGIKNEEIKIQCVELEPNKTYRLDDIDLTIHTPKSFPLNALSFICRRVRPEYCHPLLKPYQKELLISDTFEFLTTETQAKASVIMEVPIYDFPDPFEDVFIKTDLKPFIHTKFIQNDIKRSNDERKPGILKWVCTTVVDITSVRSFNLVAFSRKESFFVGDKSAEYFSSVDKFIKVSVQEKTFADEKGKVSLEVIPTPIYRPEEITSVLSVGHFYDLTHNKFEQPQKTVNLRVPLPQDYEDEGDVCLLGARIDMDYYLSSDFDNEIASRQWEIIGINPKSSRGCVNIPVEHFSIYVPTEANKNWKKETLISETSELCRRASQRRQFTVFLVLVKPIATNIYKVMIECTTKRKKDDRMNYWINKNYLDQKPSHTGEFESIPGTKYILKLSGNVKTVMGFPTTKLEFHPKRENIQHFQVTMSNPEEFNAGSIDIYEVKTQSDGTEEEEELVSVGFRLTGTPFVEDFEPQPDDTFPGFTKDSLLLRLCKGMEDEWTKVAVLLGLSFRTVENYRTNNKLSLPDKKFKVMQLWRNTSKHRVDYGVDDLVSAFHRIDRVDLVQIIQKELENWLDTHSENPDNFYRWTENKLKGPSLQPSDSEQPEPCSDKFFVLLIDKFGKHENINQVGLHMGLSRPETDKIFNDALVTSKEHQLLRMFDAAREKTGDMFKTFSNMKQAMDVLNIEDSVEWINDMAEKWLSNTEKEKNPAPWRQELLKHLRQDNEDTDSADNEENLESNEQNYTESDKKTSVHTENSYGKQDEKIEQNEQNTVDETNKNRQSNGHYVEERTDDERLGNVSAKRTVEENNVESNYHKSDQKVLDSMGSNSSIQSSDSGRRELSKSKTYQSTRKGSNISVKSSDMAELENKKKGKRESEEEGSRVSISSNNSNGYPKKGNEKKAEKSFHSNGRKSSISSLHSSNGDIQDPKETGSKSSLQRTKLDIQVNGESQSKSSLQNIKQDDDDTHTTKTTSEFANKEFLTANQTNGGMSQRPSSVTLLGLQKSDHNRETVSNVSVHSFEMEDRDRQRDPRPQEDFSSRSSNEVKVEDSGGFQDAQTEPNEPNEYASELSQKIVDEALKSAKSIHTNEQVDDDDDSQSPKNNSKTESQNNILGKDEKYTPKYPNHSKNDNENVKIEKTSTGDDINPDSESGSENKKTFLHKMSEQLPSAESSDDDDFYN